MFMKIVVVVKYIPQSKMNTVYTAPRKNGTIKSFICYLHLEQRKLNKNPQT